MASHTAGCGTSQEREIGGEGCEALHACVRIHVQVLAVAQDQNGCRFLQRKFDEGGAGAVAVVLPEVSGCGGRA